MESNIFLAPTARRRSLRDSAPRHFDTMTDWAHLRANQGALIWRYSCRMIPAKPRITVI